MAQHCVPAAAAAAAAAAQGRTLSHNVYDNPFSHVHHIHGSGGEHTIESGHLDQHTHGHAAFRFDSTASGLSVDMDSTYHSADDVSIPIDGAVARNNVEEAKKFVNSVLYGSFAKRYWAGVVGPDTPANHRQDVLHPAELYPFFNAQTGQPNLAHKIPAFEALVSLEFGLANAAAVTISYDVDREEILFTLVQAQQQPALVRSLDYMLLKYVFSKEVLKPPTTADDAAAGGTYYAAIASVMMMRETVAYMDAYSHLMAASPYLLADADGAMRSKPMKWVDFGSAEAIDTTDGYRNAALVTLLYCECGGNVCDYDLTRIRAGPIGSNVRGIPLGIQVKLYAMLGPRAAPLIGATAFCYKYLMPLVCVATTTTTSSSSALSLATVKQHVLLLGARRRARGGDAFVDVITKIGKDAAAAAAAAAAAVPAPVPARENGVQQPPPPPPPHTHPHYTVPSDHTTARLAAAVWYKHFAPALLAGMIVPGDRHAPHLLPTLSAVPKYASHVYTLSTAAAADQQQDYTERLEAMKFASVIMDAMFQLCVNTLVIAPRGSVGDENVDFVAHILRTLNESLASHVNSPPHTVRFGDADRSGGGTMRIPPTHLVSSSTKQVRLSKSESRAQYTFQSFPLRLPASDQAALPTALNEPLVNALIHYYSAVVSAASQNYVDTNSMAHSVNVAVEIARGLRSFDPASFSLEAVEPVLGSDLYACARVSLPPQLDSVAARYNDELDDAYDADDDKLSVADGQLCRRTDPSFHCSSVGLKVIPGLSRGHIALPSISAAAAAAASNSSRRLPGGEAPAIAGGGSVHRESTVTPAASPSDAAAPSTTGKDDSGWVPLGVSIMTGMLLGGLLADTYLYQNNMLTVPVGPRSSSSSKSKRSLYGGASIGSRLRRLRSTKNIA